MEGADGGKDGAAKKGSPKQGKKGGDGKKGKNKKAEASTPASVDATA